MIKTLSLQAALNTLSLPGLSDNLFSSPSWLRVIQRAYNSKILVKYIERDGHIAGYVFYTVVKSFLEWKICVLSYCDYCDAHIASEEDWRVVFEDLKKDYPEYRIVVRSLRDENVRNCGGFKELSREYFHILDLSPGADVLWKNLKGEFRNQVRQSSRRGVVVRVCEAKELKDFFWLHVRLRKYKYGIFAQPFDFFQMIWDEFIVKGQGFLLGAFLPDGKMIGATLYLVCGNTLYYKVNTSALNSLEYRTNNILLWEGIRRAKEMGLHFLDMGSSGLHQDGLVRFKDATGARRMEIVHVGYHPNGYRFSQKRILKIYTKLFNKSWVPDQLTSMGSRFIYPFLA